MKIKKNLSLLLAISIPFIMILFVAISIYVPGMFVKPKFNFLYATGGYDQEYFVSNGRLYKKEIDQESVQYGFRSVSRIFLHNVTENISREISLQQAKGLYLTSSLKSPDGFEIVYGSGGDGVFPFVFWSGRDYDSRYISGHNVSKKLNLDTSNTYYDDFHFLGWIE